MASVLPSRLVQRSVTSAKALANHTRRLSPSSVVSGRSKIGVPSSAPRISGRHTVFLASRLAKVLSCGESLMPLHSVTASALLRSMLASEVGRWGCLSEGFATPL